jgi:hypothetical protein
MIRTSVFARWIASTANSFQRLDILALALVIPLQFLRVLWASGPIATLSFFPSKMLGSRQRS